MKDNVNHPAHYTGRSIGYECIDITQYQTFCTGNAIKYLWRYKDKENPTEDLKKARWYAHRASMMQERVDIAIGCCGTILRRIIASTEGFEKAAWLGLMQSDWHLVIEALTQMIEKENK